MSTPQEIQSFFDNLESNLENEIEPHYFELPRRFRYLIEVIEVLEKQIQQTNTGTNDTQLALHDQNPAYKELLQKEEFVRNVIEDIVKFQHGSLNNSVETVGDVLKAYTDSKKNVAELRSSVGEIKTVLTSRKTGQTDLKKLWLHRTELEETLRILNNIEQLKDAPMQVQHLTNQYRYLAAVNTLNISVQDMFDIDLVDIEALEPTREILMDLKEKLLESMAEELKYCIAGGMLGKFSPQTGKGDVGGSTIGGVARRGSKSSRAGGGPGSTREDESDSGYQESDPGLSDYRSESGSRSIFNGSQTTESYTTSPRGLPGAQYQQQTLTSRNIPSSGGGARGGGWGSHAWSLDLAEATEELEASLVDPKSTGSLYIRLIVNGVGCLRCEDDTERMLFEGTAELFRTSIRRLKSLRQNTSTRGDVLPSLGGDGEAGKSWGGPSGAAGTGQSDELNYQTHIVEFTGFVRDMLESALLMLKMILYVIKLLHISKHGSVSGASNSGSSGSSGVVGGGIASGGTVGAFSLKDNIKRAIMKLWDDAQQTIIGELTRHFVEQAVEEMSDEVTGASTAAARASLSGISSSDSQSNLEDLLTVCPSSTRLAAPIYKDISMFSDRVVKIFKEDVDPQADPLVITRIHIAVQKTLESELMPLIQSEVNAEMRDLQMDPLLFAPPSGVAIQAVEGEEVDVCEAAKRCAGIIQPLYFHWSELPRHKDQVLTILDRIVRGFTSTAREELDSLSWKLVSGQAQHRMHVLSSLKKDPLLATYRLQVYDGAVSVDEIFDMISQQHNILASGGTLSDGFLGSAGSRMGMLGARRINSSDSIGSTDSRANSSREFETWQDLWDLRNTTVFKEGQDKICVDFSKLATIASIAHSCDWLVKLICKLCAASLKKLSSHQQSASGTSRRTMSLGVNLDDVHASQQLVTSIKGGAQSLEKLAEECIAVLRGEMQVVAFYFLRQLVTLQLNNTGSGAGGGKAPGGNSAGKTSFSSHTPSHARSHATSHLMDGDGNIVTILNHHLMSMQDAITSAAYPSLLAVVISPLVELVPSFFMRSVMSFSPMESTSIADSSRLLKSVVACQQNISMLLESSSLDPATDRSLQDRVTEEFDRLRRFLSLLHMRPVPEFQDYLRAHPDEFTVKEYTFAWGYLRHKNDSMRLPSYEELLKQIATSSPSPSANSTSSFSIDNTTSSQISSPAPVLRGGHHLTSVVPKKGSTRRVSIAE